MGKIRKRQNKNSFRHNPLDQQILEGRFAQPSGRNKNRSKQLNTDNFVDGKQTRDILKQAREQQEEIEREVGVSVTQLHKKLSLNLSNFDDDDEKLLECNSDIAAATEIKLPEINEEDEKALEKFRGSNLKARQTLTDIIKEKLTEKKTEIDTIYTDTGSVYSHQPADKSLLYFKSLAPILSVYRSGKLPKAFKAIPKFSNWEQILYYTEPDKWSAATMYQATRMFSSNLQDKMAQRFYNLILLPRLRDDIAESKSLNFHLYQALKKALFKPGAFFRGMIIPLCQAEDSTLREASIIGSILAKCSIPVLHSSAAIGYIADLPYNGVSSIFLRILLEKKYALPYKAIDKVLDHFVRSMDDSREFPLLWHQCLLTFVQIYKSDLSEEKKKNLLKVTTVHRHEQVTPEIRKELEGTIETTDATQLLFKI